MTDGLDRTDPTPRRTSSRLDLDAAIRLTDALVADGTLPSAVLGVSDASGTRLIHAVGGPRHRRVAPDSVYFLASITKPIVATATMQLVDEGRLDLDAPLRPGIPGFRGLVTARHVLTHTSGIPDVDLAPLIRRAPTFGSLLSVVHDAEPTFLPGSRYRYGSDSFMLLAETIAARTGCSFATALRRRLLQPLGMVDTGFDPARWARRVVTVDGAPGGSRIGRRFVQRFLARATFAGGGSFGTAEDLLRFGRSLMGGPDVPRVLSEGAIAEMTREQTMDVVELLEDGTELAPHYALGWHTPAPGPDGVSIAGVALPTTRAVVTHGGVSGTRLWLDRERGLGVVVLSSRWGLDQGPLVRIVAAVYRGDAPTGGRISTAPPGIIG